MSEINEEKDTKKSKSKIGALLSNSQEVNNSEVNVYYSQNDWKTSDKIEVMVEDKTTVLQLIDIVIFKLKTELYYDDIDEKKNYILMLLKKKTKKPNQVSKQEQRQIKHIIESSKSKAVLYLYFSEISLTLLSYSALVILPSLYSF